MLRKSIKQVSLNWGSAYSFQTRKPARLHHIFYPSLDPSCKINLIALHCYLLTSKSLDTVLNNEKIRKRVNVYSLDIRNHGDSEWKDSISLTEISSLKT